ncbi:unnamed protein product [Rotaria magnacalcarata]|uniref:Dpy-30-like protein n=2 Tax=Rotaria magnacalcarata TaxID=392030 RepID=A0A819XYM4_9BILA|nr:unnamed protein product [Rotaria magnacalcarata]CAF1681286.1 unnamed protein product [Rotaria magnacalcarata]CAF2072651.1 unnamed protein product [Rotaria magnacalcarata]CAF2107502.1 unnamed protein product [Rotaria magnacalcarata]CAF2150362.1 unnamed protein product [Rotaria magnacalcarata]
MANSEHPTTNDIIAADVILQDPSSSSVNTMVGGAPQLPSNILQIIDHEINSPSVPSLADIQAYPTAAYFNKTVTPIIIEGLSVVAKERPKKPIEYLAAFLIKNRERFGESV